MAELREVMRRRGDGQFIEILDKIRIGYIDVHAECILTSGFVEFYYQPGQSINLGTNQKVRSIVQYFARKTNNIV